MTAPIENTPAAIIWPASQAVVQLNAPRPPRRPPTTEGVRGRLAYLSRLGAVVQPAYFDGQSWRCRIIACDRTRAGDASDRLARVADEELVAAPTTVEITDEDGFLLAWRCAVWHRWPGGPVAMAARAIAVDLCPPGMLEVDLDPSALRRLAEATRMRPSGVDRLVMRLVVTGLLCPTASDGRNVYALSLPVTALTDPASRPGGDR